MKRNVWIWALSALILSGCLRVEDDPGISESRYDAETSQSTTKNKSEREIQVVLAVPGQEERQTEAPELTETKNGRVLLAGRSVDARVLQINEKTIGNQKSGVVDLFQASYDVEQVRGLISQYVFPEGEWLDGVPITEADRKAIEENRNLQALTQGLWEGVSYGILKEEADVRSFPTAHTISAAQEGADSAFDYFQETLFVPGEAVAVLHTSADGTYSFVQGANYCGWVLESAIAHCDKEVAEAFLNVSDFAVVTENFLDTEKDGSTKTLRMGTVLPLLWEEGQFYQVICPCDESRADGALLLEDGRLTFYTTDQLPEGADPFWVMSLPVKKTAASKGYVPFETAAVMELAEKMLGSAYAWGDGGRGYDCSSTLGRIYACLGLVLPRNSGTLPLTGAQVKDLSAMSSGERRQWILDLTPGSILVMKGHVTLYMGEQTVGAGADQQTCPAMLHNVTGYMDVDGTICSPYSCVLTALDISSRGGIPYTELFTYSISFGTE